MFFYNQAKYQATFYQFLLLLMCDRFSDPLLPSPSQLIREKKHNNFLLGVNVVVFLFSGSGSLIMGKLLYILLNILKISN